MPSTFISHSQISIPTHVPWIYICVKIKLFFYSVAYLFGGHTCSPIESKFVSNWMQTEALGIDYKENHYVFRDNWLKNTLTNPLHGWNVQNCPTVDVQNACTNKKYTKLRASFSSVSSGSSLACPFPLLGFHSFTVNALALKVDALCNCWPNLYFTSVSCIVKLWVWFSTISVLWL